MEADFNALEEKVAELIRLYHSVRTENLQLRQELAHARDESRQLREQMAQASNRLEILLDKLPEGLL